MGKCSHCPLSHEWLKKYVYFQYGTPLDCEVRWDFKKQE